jgi:mitochondrial fission protein ELM1
MKTVIEMAREAGLVGGPVYARGLEAFAELVRADEREACAKVCDWYVDYSSNPMNFTENCAQEIRARSNT